MRHFRIPVVLLLLVLFMAGGCVREERGEVPGVAATEAYVRHFGAAPTVKEGTCSAAVAYFPLADNPALVRPVPLFLFSSEGKMEKVVRHLLALDQKVLDSSVRNPFPAGTELKSLTRDGDALVVQLAFGGSRPQDVRGMASSLSHTLAQFSAVRRVRVLEGGKPLPGLDPAGVVPDPAEIREPGGPRPLGVAGAWEQGASTAEEVLVLFDRPVSIEKIEVLSGGNPLTGEYYQSAFDMAVVVHPARADLIREGMPVEVKWHVADRRGRSSTGSKAFSLQRQDRP